MAAIFVQSMKIGTHENKAICSTIHLGTEESFIFVGLKFRGFQISDKLVGI